MAVIVRLGGGEYGYDLTNTSSLLSQSANSDGTTSSVTYTATQEGEYMVISTSGAAQANGYAYASASTSGTILISAQDDNSNPNAIAFHGCSYYVIVSHLKVGQTISGSARGSNTYGRSRVCIYQVS